MPDKLVCARWDIGRNPQPEAGRKESQMLRKVRIEVTEPTAEACVDALNKYEHAIQQQEAKRYHHLWPIDEEDHIEDVPWSYGVPGRRYYHEFLSREIVEEVIEYDSSRPCYL